MGVKINGLNNLDRFIKKCNIVKNANSILGKIVEEVARQGQEILSYLYSSTQLPIDNEMPKVNYNILSENKAEIVASGESVMFIEFGTGTRGKESNYKGNLLPFQTISFEVGGETHYTTGWQYNYNNPITKFISKSTGEITWKVPKSIQYPTKYINAGGFSHGQPSGQQIFDTARELERLIPQITKQVLDKEFANV